MIKRICCPVCHKLIGRIDENGEMKKVYLWCRHCKKEKYIENSKDFESE